MSDDAQADACAGAAYQAFTAWQRDYRAITRRGDRRFLERDWRGLAQDVVERHDVYTDQVQLLTQEVRRTLGGRVEDRALWARIREAYARRVVGLAGRELAATFFNSLTRRIFATVGVDTSIEFVDPEERVPTGETPTGALATHVRRGSSIEVVQRVLEASPLAGLLAEPQASARLIAGEIERATGGRALDEIEVLRPLFHRGFGAFLIGRVRSGTHSLPLAVSFLNLEGGAVVDAVLLEEDEVSIVFSFTRSYFLVDVEDPVDAVPFLRRLMPRKPVAELYTALGYNKHGKTVFYRDLLRHVERTDERFVVAPGDRGLVMIVFTMPSYDVVFKVIRDRILPPKTVAREEVRARYQLVFRHDRAGRLADAQEFEHLTFDRGRFSEELLEELVRDAAGSVRLEGGAVVLEHAYTERRMTPLNLHLQTAGPAAAQDAVLDYGRAVRDLARSNIFPGDLLLKNFGVTRHGRVVFYDYDELCLLTDCHFRELPKAAEEDELRGECWFYVRPNDVFPEEFRTFIGLPRQLLEVLEARHGELFDAAWWRHMQQEHRQGVLPRIFPYPRSRRLRGPGAALPA